MRNYCETQKCFFKCGSISKVVQVDGLLLSVLPFDSKCFGPFLWHIVECAGYYRRLLVHMNLNSVFVDKYISYHNTGNN